MDLLLDIPMCAYNHEKYIAQAIEGVVMQKTNFKFRVFIGEDASIDNTRNIIIKYSLIYPEIIFPILHDINLGAAENTRILLSKCTSKYLAMCDGDDYWTDPYKLQKQVDFLEVNPEYGLCYSDIIIVNDNNYLLSCDPSWKALYKSGYIFKDLFIQNFIPTVTVVVRKNFMDSALQNLQLYPSLKVFDYWFWLYISMFTKFRFFDEKLAAYRDHSQGITDSKEFNRDNFLLMVYRIKINIIENYCNISNSKKIVPGIKEKLSLLKEAIQLFYKTPTSFLSRKVRFKYLFKILIN